MKIIRVLHYIGSLEFGGSQSFVMELYRKIDKRKIQFDFVVFTNEVTDFNDEIRALGGNVYNCPKYRGINHKEFVRWWKSFFKKHKEYKVFHCHVRSTALICIPIAKKNGCYAIAHAHSTSNGSGINGFIKNVMQLPVRFMADYMFACSDAAGIWMFGKKIIKSKKYNAIHNAIDTYRFAFSPKRRETLRDELGISDKFVIGNVGRFSEPKNHIFLIDAFYELAKKRDDVSLLLIGDGEKRESIETRVNQKGLSDKVIFAGSKNNTEDYYQAMDVFVFPSIWEGLGIVAIEAQCAGLFCIVSENVPRDVDIGAGLVKFLSLNETAEKWCKEIEEIEGRARKSCSVFVKKAGYDIGDNVKKMQNFYLKVSSRAEQSDL